MRPLKSFKNNTLRTIAILSLAFALSSCGREAPFSEPGTISVVSDPSGAQIFLNGADTGEITPHTFTGLQPSAYLITVALAGFIPVVPEVKVNLGPLDDQTVAFQFSQTGLEVTSPVAGATIFLDGVDTGLVTPATIVGLEAATYQVALVLDTYLVSPPELEIEVIAGEVVTLPPASFAMRPQRTVILEGFANIDCGPCPQLTANLVAFAEQPEFSRERVIYIEFSVGWPNLVDPLYLFNATENSDRFTDYGVFAAPDLYTDGVGLSDALDLPALEASVRTDLAVDPQFVIDVAADFTNPTVLVTVDLLPSADLDLTDHSLYVALYEDVIDFDQRGLTPGSNGQTVFHHVFRDRVDALPTIGLLQDGTTRTFNLNLARGNWELDNLVVIAFVQRDSDFAIIQAGSVAGTAKSEGKTP